MNVHPQIHTEFARQRQLDLHRQLARPRAPSRLRKMEAPESAAAGELAALVRAAAGGNAPAWESLVGRYSPALRAAARGYQLSATDVDDVVQATWAAAFTHICRLREPVAIGGWLLVIARREALRVLRRKQREIPVGEPEWPVHSADRIPESALLEREQSHAVQAAIGRLPARQRSLLSALLTHSDSSYTDISLKLTIPVGSIGPTRKRALAHLRRDKYLATLAEPRYDDTAACPPNTTALTLSQ